MATNNQLNSNFHQIAVADANGVVTGVSLSGETTLGDISNITITGGSTGQVMTTDGAGNLSWSTVSSGDANYANFAGVVTTAAQPNITSVGNLTDLTVAGNINASTIKNGTSEFAQDPNIGITVITTNGNSTQFMPSGQINLSGSSIVAGGTFGGSQLELATSQTNLKQIRDGNVTVQVGTAGATTSTWTFGNNGNMTLPSNSVAINYANGVSITALVPNATFATTAGSADSVAGANVTGTVANATYATTSGSADLVAGANVTGTVGSANTAATVTTNAQPNITSTGTLTSLVVSGTSNLGPVDNVTITGGSNGQILTTNGSNVLSWTTAPTPTQIVNGNSNVSIASSNGAVSVSVTGMPNTVVFNNGNTTFNMPLIVPAGESTVTTRIDSDLGLRVIDSSNPSVQTTIYATGPSQIAGNLTVTQNLSLKGFTETAVTVVNTGTAILPDASSGTIKHYTANNNFTFNGFTNPVAGQSMTIVITQDATGSRLMTSTMKFAGATKTLSTAPNAIDMICVVFTGVFYLASLAKGYA